MLFSYFVDLNYQKKKQKKTKTFPIHDQQVARMVKRSNIKHQTTVMVQLSHFSLFLLFFLVQHTITTIDISVSKKRKKLSKNDSKSLKLHDNLPTARCHHF